jgi:superoxide dismutase, Fe-Mn family
VIFKQNGKLNRKEPQMAFELPPLPYDYDALEPYIDEETMHLHHDKHHQTYVTNANAALAGTEWADRPVEEVLQNLDQISAEKRNAVRNNAGGHYNHSLFWEWMSPNGGGEPDGDLLEALGSAFGSVEDFKSKLKSAGAGQFGSGWAFLVPDGSSLAVISTPNQDSPIASGTTPLLGVDVWEHAYYLKYQNRRPDYIDAWWNVVNWSKVAESYAAISKALSAGRPA